MPRLRHPVAFPVEPACWAEIAAMPGRRLRSGEDRLALFHEGLAAFLVVVAVKALLHQRVGQRDVALRSRP